MGVELDDYIGITAVVGEEGSGKSTMALTWPRPLFHIELDIGGFRRASWFAEKSGIRILELQPDSDIKAVDWTQYDVVTKPYPQPLDKDRMLGQMIGSDTRIQFPKRVVGMLELWQRIIIDYVEVVQIPAVRTIVPDSATMFWQIDHKGVLQELQDKQKARWQDDVANKHKVWDDNLYREKLQPQEYASANDKMRQVFHTAAAFRKNLVLVHYPTDEYGAVVDRDGNTREGKTGKKVIDGFGETMKTADLAVWVSVKEQMSEGKKVIYPSAKITKCGVRGMGLTAVGTEFMASFDGFQAVRRLMTGGK